MVIDRELLQKPLEEVTNMKSQWDNLVELYNHYKCFHVNFFPKPHPDPKKVPLLASIDDSGSSSVLAYAEVK